MSEHCMTWDALGELPHKDIPRWVDAHSVTCALCGELADERETVKLWPDAVGPEIREKVETIVDDVGHGEAHQSCFNEYGET